MNWFTKLFNRMPAPKKMKTFEVGRLVVKVRTKDGHVHQFPITGYVNILSRDWFRIVSAPEILEARLKYWGDIRMVEVAEGHLVSHDNIATITCETFPHSVTKEIT